MLNLYRIRFLNTAGQRKTREKQATSLQAAIQAAQNDVGADWAVASTKYVMAVPAYDENEDARFNAAYFAKHDH